MRINLNYPFTQDFKSGYILTNKEPRRLVCLVRHDLSRTTVSYARYLMSCHLGRYLNSDEHVDHIDGNKLNDIIENLQILSPKDNNIKKLYQTGKKLKMLEMKCPSCGVNFVKPHGTTHLGKKGKYTCCSKKCLHQSLKMKYTQHEMVQLGVNQIIREFRQ